MHTSGEALWLDERTLAVPAHLDVEGAAWELCYSAAGGIAVVAGHVTGADGFIPLVSDPRGLDAQQRARDPYLSAVFTPDGSDFHVLRPAMPLAHARLERILTGELVIARSHGSRVTAVTLVQCARILDALYAAEASQLSYGPSFSGDTVTIRVWAPTARNVRLRIGEQLVAMRRSACGAWEASGNRTWIGAEYAFEVTVYVPRYVARPRHQGDERIAGKIQHFTVVDPMATGLTLNGRRGVVVDLTDPAWMPENWLHAQPVELRNPSEHAIYELHVRDYSIADASVPEALRGTYAAFGTTESRGYRALAQLRRAGMNTIHLLPTYDIGSIPEDRADQRIAEVPAVFSPDSEGPQAAIARVADEDGFNWGYDPVHYGVPEGSYASPGHQEGGARVAEFRSMIGALHELGYHVVLDQVFNHTFEYGLAPSCTFERIVPGYYYRLGYDGETLTTPCSGEFATEHAMAEKLMIDTLVRWARHCSGTDVSIFGRHCGYCSQPHEAINYVDAHDNETLFDYSIWRMPHGTPMGLRVRMNTLALAAVTLGQSPCFWHAGTELLRSKSLDADSFNSGDWFNAIDWSGQTSRFGVGLPPANRNGERWDAMRPLLRDPNNRPDSQHIAQARQAALDLLRLRSSTPLFTLGSAELIEEMISFPGAGPTAPPGFITMRIYDWARRRIDRRLAGLLIVFNFSGETVAERLYGLAGTQLRLSPIQATSDDVVNQSRWDEHTGTVIVPGYTVAVFEQPWP
ncbi:MAG: DUF3372 domain-containing protein [Ancrocorticia sp.]|jgi:pullulanase/glycogen debranching enzyme|nr:DUF3372 domain-containing protein [Ancrocorticia sp.]